MGMLHKEENVFKSFYDEMKGELDMHSADNLVICFGDLSEHIDWHIY